TLAHLERGELLEPDDEVARLADDERQLLDEAPASGRDVAGGARRLGRREVRPRHDLEVAAVAREGERRGRRRLGRAHVAGRAPSRAPARRLAALLLGAGPLLLAPVARRDLERLLAAAGERLGLAQVGVDLADPQERARHRDLVAQAARLLERLAAELERAAE